ncbi:MULTISPECIES: UDP-N-acetylmuramoyl-L-alanine--D-glutamate ligase [unclassified Herbaspirillum]|uniref:UDP-N-acetylmuramoyl-L-alanine--D-glutamate ligase n=1 Tax=unclassified Herbaspirillum TaxID=2624150 RepID=UPI000E2F2D75|nr:MULTISPECIES: UDP-N-acetylmuramoyl-L-alanine--D-glutamate ligase [unclassified Herbaspirillum]RFB67870.1 UDP-N-acetylmuramoyl-L-alanine--D-glutamate ligase [Herbaspirillum sp. 3R-3a1]TFI06306.1 UDP-N-acetylmuramoyl-L-alanine--D-glutamate ligase [Herbaspirillum sp. 3R11]TFI14082.1 UDP-N-acetylmuramoyl-L-alanine--D-glutamate ligase [Herbaspirillum sp. 3R-11]TFI27887.1 UDP-N-acetylmuramoyl-L-alanine--D-glutamate ligase [Herbaspirillum sp. 3C11]
MNYVDKHALVLGLGESGLAMAQWLVHCGARVRVADTRDEQAVAERLAALRAVSGDIEFVGGQALSAGLLDGVDFVAVSPGLAPGRELAAVSAAASERNIPLWGEMELFAQALAALREERAYAPKVLAITGTNGKTTVTSLTGMLCRRAGLTTKVAGNISPAVLDVLRQALIDDEAHAKVVAEQLRIEQEAAALQAEADAVEAEKLAAEVAQQAAIEAAEAERKAAEEAALAAAASAQMELREQEEAAELQAAIDEAANESKEANAPATQAALIEGDAVLSVEASADPDADADSNSATVEGDAQQEAIADAEVQAAQDEFEQESAMPEVVPADEEDTTPLQLELPPPEPEKVYTGILPQAWVLELSSFQLHSTHSLQPSAATVLNVTQDHLDWHGDMDAYAADKAKIFGDGTVRVLNRDDALVMQMTKPGAIVSSFGMGEPTKAGDFGLVDENGMLWLANAVVIEDEEKPEGRRRKKDPKEVVEQPFQLKRLMPADALRIRGLHNALNGLAALALCRAVDLPLAPLLHGLREYTGEPHRVELVTTIQDVEYYDDSKGTNVGATVAALNGLGHGGKPNRLLLIAGGEGKGQDFAPLAEPLAKYGRAVFLIGRDAGAIRSAVTDSGVELIDCATLEEAVEKAGAMAQGGDAVLLSPACASFDMFRNYGHRAEVFVDAVRELALSRGEVM